MPHRKDPLVTTVCLSVRSLDLTKMSLTRVVGSSESNKRYGLKDAVASRGGERIVDIELSYFIQTGAAQYDENTEANFQQT